MKIIQILPALEEGGVERHVLWLSGELVSRGHEVCVVSSGGRLVSALPAQVEHWTLPVEAKNPFSALSSAFRIASRVQKEGWAILHAHSRVPAWIALVASTLAKCPYMVTAHGIFGNRHRIVYLPYRRAARILCVSRAVQEEMACCFSENTAVVRNGLPPADKYWAETGGTEKKFLFIGRLTPLKGLQDIIEILPLLQGSWRLDVVGDGPLFSAFSARSEELKLTDRLFFHGFRDDTDEWLAGCSCLLFPSYSEGMPLTLARAVQMGVPVLASHIPPVEEMAESPVGLLPPGDREAWRNALQSLLDGHVVLPDFSSRKIPSLEEMGDKIEDIYGQILAKIKRGDKGV
ncbi:glycosyltransferase family 4 protein [Aminivibrio sp.]